MSTHLLSRRLGLVTPTWTSTPPARPILPSSLSPLSRIIKSSSETRRLAAEASFPYPRVELDDELAPASSSRRSIVRLLVGLRTVRDGEAGCEGGIVLRPAFVRSRRGEGKAASALRGEREGVRRVVSVGEAVDAREYGGGVEGIWSSFRRRWLGLVSAERGYRSTGLGDGDSQVLSDGSEGKGMPSKSRIW
jgi:hypothetical protein